MPDVCFRERGFDIRVSGVDEPGAVTAPNFPTQEAHLADAFRRIPDAHVRFIPRIEVGDSAPGGSFRPDLHRILLNRETFGSSWNRNYLFTLIHEIGHAVDRGMHAVAQFMGRTGRSGNDWTTYRSIPYNGRNRRADGTPQYGEHFAEGYAIALTRPTRLTHPQLTLIHQIGSF